MPGYYCDSDHDTAADMLLTNLHTGDVAAYCSGCAPAMLRAMADAMAPAPENGAAPGPQDGQDGREEGEAAPDPPEPKRRRTGRTAAHTEAISGQAPDARPADDDS